MLRQNQSSFPNKIQTKTRLSAICVLKKLKFILIADYNYGCGIRWWSHNCCWFTYQHRIVCCQSSHRQIDRNNWQNLLLPKWISSGHSSYRWHCTLFDELSWVSVPSKALGFFYYSITNRSKICQKSNWKRTVGIGGGIWVSQLLLQLSWLSVGRYYRCWLG